MTFYKGLWNVRILAHRMDVILEAIFRPWYWKQVLYFPTSECHGKQRSKVDSVSQQNNPKSRMYKVFVNLILSPP